jgi:hypothetical protein
MNKNNENKQPVEPTNVEKKTNEQAGFYFSSSLKISDPETGEVLVQMRCD